MLGFDGGGVVRAENKQPPSKTSGHARFRWWRGGEGGKQAAAIKNELVHSFSMVVGWWGRKTSGRHRKRACALVFDDGGVVVAENKWPPSKTSADAHFQCKEGTTWPVGSKRCQ